jgi:hypothetical protein
MRTAHRLVLIMAIATFPLIALAQYDIVVGSVREDSVDLNGVPATRNSFQVLTKKGSEIRTYIVTVFRENLSGLTWSTFEQINEAAPVSKPTTNWMIARSLDGRSIAGFRVVNAEILVRESRQSTPSISAARSAAVTDLAQQPTTATASNAMPLTRVSVSARMEVADFSGASGLRQSDLRRVVATEQGWLIELSSHPSLSSTALVTLSRDFKLLNIEIRKI